MNRRMNSRTGTGAIFLLLLSLLPGAPASAHRLDEYLQATTLSVETGRVRVQMRLTPGVAVYPRVLAAMDTNADGALSAAEQRAYAERVRRDLSLRVNGQLLPLRLVSWTFAPTEKLRQGRGDIQLDLSADVPRGSGRRRLLLENRHQSRISVYLVNCLVPRDPAIRVTGQRRSFQQSFYRLDYVQAAGA